MNIRSLGRERQHGLHGMVVNVPIDVDKTVNQLPRTFLQSQTIQLQLFRKVSFQKPYLYETIRPNIVLEAARYLSNTELFKQQKIALSVTWIDDVSGGETKVDFIINPGDKPVITDNEQLVDPLFGTLEELLKEIDEWDETKNDLPINPDFMDTLLVFNDDMLLKLAPGEGRTPLHLRKDEFIEELAYPCVFAGAIRELPEDLSILKKAKSDILRLVILYTRYAFSLFLF